MWAEVVALITPSEPEEEAHGDTMEEVVVAQDKAIQEDAIEEVVAAQDKTIQEEAHADTPEDVVVAQDKAVQEGAHGDAAEQVVVVQDGSVPEEAPVEEAAPHDKAVQEEAPITEAIAEEPTDVEATPEEATNDEEAIMSQIRKKYRLPTVITDPLVHNQTLRREISPAPEFIELAVDSSSNSPDDPAQSSVAFPFFESEAPVPARYFPSETTKRKRSSDSRGEGWKSKQAKREGLETFRRKTTYE